MLLLRCLVAGALVLQIGAWATLPASAAGRHTIPISQHRLSNGDVRFTVPIRIGDGRAIEAMLDTGSFGLRVMSRAVAPSQYTPTGIVRGYGYGSGVVLRGSLARARISIGGATAPGIIQVVRSVVCRQGRPRCPASRVTPEDYRIGGDGLAREGYDAILGISMRSSSAPGAAANPLLAIGGRSWIVILPAPGASRPGTLIINPSAADEAGFHPVSVRRVAAGNGGVMDSQIPNCADRPLDQQALCPMIPLDSGARRGVAPFYSFAVLYDEANGSISVKRRSDRF